VGWKVGTVEGPRKGSRGSRLRSLEIDNCSPEPSTRPGMVGVIAMCEGPLYAPPWSQLRDGRDYVCAFPLGTRPGSSCPAMRPGKSQGLW
jgi:hypothetical protein